MLLRKTVLAMLAMAALSAPASRAAQQTHSAGQCGRGAHLGLGATCTELREPPPESYRNSHGIHPLFWTPIWRVRTAVSQQTEALLQIVDAIRAAQPNGTVKSNIGGWQSPGNLLQIDGVSSNPVFQQLVAELTTQANAFLDAQARSVDGTLSARLTRVWANVNSFGDSNAPHVHPESHLAGVIYISTGGDAGAKLELMDPRANLHHQASVMLRDRRTRNTTRSELGRPNDSDIAAQLWQPGLGSTHTIEPGLAVVFPADVPHWVWPHAGRKHRVSFSFNAVIEHLTTTSKPRQTTQSHIPWEDLYSELARDALRKARQPGDSGSQLALQWGTPVWLASKIAADACERLAERIVRAASADMSAIPQSKFKPNRHLVRPWLGSSDMDPLELSSQETNGDSGVAQIRSQVYWQLGWFAAEMLGAIDGNRPVTMLDGQDTPAIVSARLLSARPMALSAAQRQQNAVVMQSNGDDLPQVCGLLGLKSPAGGAYAELLFHDPTTPSMFGSTPKKVTTFKLRAGVLVMFPCWLRYDLTLAGALPEASLEDYDPHVVLELTATLELAEYMACRAGSSDTAESSGMQPGEEKSGWMHLFAEHLQTSTRNE